MQYISSPCSGVQSLHVISTHMIGVKRKQIPLSFPVSHDHHRSSIYFTAKNGVEKFRFFRVFIDFFKDTFIFFINTHGIPVKRRQDKQLFHSIPVQIHQHRITGRHIDQLTNVPVTVLCIRSRKEINTAVTGNHCTLTVPWEQTQLLVAHRYITRDASAGSENHIALSEREFFTRAGQNLLALSWHANGLYYGVGIEIDLWLHAGFDVVVNGSRAHLPQARARYQSALLPICLQVSPEILRQRLENRGRENASEINARLARAARYTPQDCLTLNNDGSLRQSVDKLLTLIHQKEKHHACL